MAWTKPAVPLLLVAFAMGLSSGALPTCERRLIPGSCTIFCVAKGQAVLFGNNEDWRNPKTFVWLVPAFPTGSRPGAVAQLTAACPAPPTSWR
ncbi:hypothetical protein FJ251_02695 [bacterium]|nr:hypothetical protein [bacterium]